MADVENNDLISVLIPSYNHAPYIEETLYSVMSQDYKNLELLICDDGSTDGTWDIIQKLSIKCKQRFVNTYFIQEAHSGIHNSLSKLLHVAQGKYIFIIASDDIVKSCAISTMHSFLKKNSSYGLCVGDNEIIGQNSFILSKKTIGARFHNRELDAKSKFGSYEILLHKNHIPNGYLIRSQFFDNFLYNPTTFEDYYTMLQISKCYKMKYLDTILFSYRKHNSNTIDSPETHKNLFKIERNLFFNEREYCITHDYFDSWTARIAKMIVTYGDFPDAQMMARNALDNRGDLLWANIFLALLHVKNGSFQNASEYVVKIFCTSFYKSELLPYIVFIINQMSDLWRTLYIKNDIKKLVVHHLIIGIEKKFSNFLEEDAYFATRQYLSFALKYTDYNIELWKVYDRFTKYYSKSLGFNRMKKEIVRHIFISKDKIMIKQICYHYLKFILSFFSMRRLRF